MYLPPPEALTRQRLTRMTEQPEHVTLDGYDGQYVELHAPDDIDFADCEQGYYDMWASAPDGGKYMQQPGQMDRLWILDVEGEVLVLDATAVPGATQADRDAITEIVESVDFVPRT